MATYWLTHGSYPAYAAIPTTLGVNGAQDGDGLASILAKSAVGSLDITSVATVGSTLTIMGVVLTAVASGATAAQFNVGASTSIQATNIATALNAATGQVVVGVSLSRHQLRNMIYAWAVGSVVNVMTRAGSSLFNHTLNANMVIGVTGALTATVTQLSGGVSGAWGYFSNDDIIWPSSISKNQYGAIYGTIGFSPLALINVLNQYDWVWVRANNNVNTINSSGFTFLSISAKGTFCVDDGTIWSGDTGTFKITTSGATCSLSGSVGGNVRFTSKLQSKFIIEVTGSGTISMGIGSQVGQQSWVLDNVTLLDNGGFASFISLGYSSGGTWGLGADITYSRIKLVVTANKFYSFIAGIQANTNVVSTLIDNIVADFSTYTGTPSVGCISKLDFLGNAGGYGQSLKIKNMEVICANKPYVAVGAILGGSSVAGIGNKLEIENIVGCLPFASLGLFGSMTAYGNQESNYVRQAGIGSVRQFKLETNSCIVDTDTTSNYPVFNSSYPDGTPYILALTWPGTGLVGSLRNFQGVEVFNWSIPNLVAGNNVVTLDILLDGLIVSSVTNLHLIIEVSYIDTLGSNKTVRSAYPSTNEITLPSSGLIPTLNGFNGYVARSINCTITEPQLNSELDVTLYFFKPAPTPVSSKVFINPEVSLHA